MEPNSFGAILNARAIAIIGASSNTESLAGRPIGYLRRYGYGGRIYPVNPARAEIQGIKAYPSIVDVPERVELAMVAVRAELVPGALRECVAAGVKIAIVVSSGFGEGNGAGDDLAEQLKQIVAETDLRIIGPNCEGLWSMPNKMPLTFSPVADIERTGRTVEGGDIAVVSHSGGLAFAVAQWCAQFGLGVNYVVSLGNEADLDAMTVAEAVLERPDARVIVLLVEGFTDHQRAIRLGARAAELGKHVVAAKLGRSAPGKRATYRHTLHEAGEAGIYDLLFAEAGIHQTFDEDDLVDTIHILSKAPKMAGTRVAILATSGGSGVWLADACDAAGLDVPEFSAGLQAALVPLLPSYGSPMNPVDLTAQFLVGGTFAEALGVVCASGEIDGVIIATSLAAAGRLDDQGEGLHGAMATYGLPVAMFSYTAPAPSNAEILQHLGIPYFPTTRRAANAVARLAGAGQH